MKSKYLVVLVYSVGLYAYADVERNEPYSLDAFLESSSPLYKLAKFVKGKFGSQLTSVHEDRDNGQKTIEQSLNPGVQNKLMVAINRSNSRDAENAISMGANVNARTVFGSFPLHWAALLDGSAILSTLLSHGADVNARDRNGKTPLHWAAGRGHIQTVKMLLAYGAKTDVKDNEGLTPLDYAEDKYTRDVLLEGGSLIR